MKHPAYYLAHLGAQALLVAAFVSLTGCDVSTPARTHDGERSGLDIRTDAETGCQYITHTRCLDGCGTAITPRLGVDGLPVCGTGSGLVKKGGR